MATTVMQTTPDRSTSRSMRAARSDSHIFSSSPVPRTAAPLRRQPNFIIDPPTPSHHVGTLPLSIGPTRRSLPEPSRARTSLKLRPVSCEIPTRLPRISTTASKHEPSSCIPAVRPAVLSLVDLEAPKRKRRSVEFPQLAQTLTRLTPPKPKARSSTVHRLPAPVFHISERPQLRRAITSPHPLYLDMSDSVQRNSDGMTRLTLRESQSVPIDDGARLFRGLSGADSRASHHSRSRSGDLKSAKRRSLNAPLDDVFDVSSSPPAIITPRKEPLAMDKATYPPITVTHAESPLQTRELNIDPISRIRPEGLPEFVLHEERGIAKKRSNLLDGLAPSFPKSLSSKVSRFTERMRAPRDSGPVGFSFEGEHDDDAGDASFASMTSLGSPVKTSELTPEGTHFNFLAGLDPPEVETIQVSAPALHPLQIQDLPMVTPGFEPTSSSGWPEFHGFQAGDVVINSADLDSDDEGETGEIDMDSILFTTMQAKQSGRRSSAPTIDTKPLMPDTPVKHTGRPSIITSRPWNSTIKAPVDRKKLDAPRKSLPSKFTPFSSRISSANVMDSPCSDGSEFSPTAAFRSPSPSLRPLAPVGALRRRSSLLSLGLPTTGRKSLLPRPSPPSPQTPSAAVVPDLLTGMGITQRRADLMRRTNSSAWSFESESSSDGGFGSPSPRANAQSRQSLEPVSPQETPAPSFGPTRKSVSFIDTSPLTRRSFGRFESRLEVPPSPSLRLSGINVDTIMESAPSTPASLHFGVSRFPALLNRPPSPLPAPGYWGDSDEDCNENVVLDFGIKEEPQHFENEFLCEEGLGAGSFGQAFKVVARSSSVNGKPRLFAVKKSKPYEGAKHRLRLLEEFDILRHLATTTTPRRSRSLSLSLSSALAEAPNANVLHFVHGWEQDSMLCIQTELCELGNLSDFLFEYGAKFNRLDEPRIWKIMSEVGNGIMHIHHQNVIHLDLKPANIFITIEGRLRIGDFGMASRWPRPSSFGDGNDGLDREGDREYMAPEILSGRYGREADIFSFGMIMLECAGNIVVPSMGDPWQRLRNRDLSDVDLVGLTPTLIDMITRLMSPEPELRPLIDQVCAHDVVHKTRSLMLHNIEAVRRAAMTLIGNASPGEASAAREAADVALFKASALGTEDETFFAEVFPAAGTDGEQMDMS